MTTYICTLYYPPGDTHDLPRSVLLPSGPIKRPSQHSVAIWQLLSSSPSEEERGLRGGGGGRVGSTDAFSFSLSRGILYFSSSAHVTMCTYAPVEILATHIHIYIYTYTHTHIHIHIHVYSLVHIDSWSLSHLGYLYPGTTPVMIKLTAGHQLPLTHRALTVPRYHILRVLNRLFLYSCSKPEHPPVGDHSCTTGNRSRNLSYDSWSLSHLGYLYPGTTPVMIKLDHNRSCPWV